MRTSVWRAVLRIFVAVAIALSGQIANAEELMLLLVIYRTGPFVATSSCHPERTVTVA